MNKERRFDDVFRALRRAHFQGTLFGQTIAIRLGLSESDIEALTMLLETGAATAGRLSELLGLSTGAVTRMIDRLEQAGYVRRTTDPADRRRVVVEVVPEKTAVVEELLGRVASATAEEIGRYSPEQLELIGGFLQRLADATRTETTRLREVSEPNDESPVEGEHSAPLAGMTSARLAFRSGAATLRLSGSREVGQLYRAHFDGAMPQVRVREGTVWIHYRGLPFDWRERRADIVLNATIPWAIAIQGGASKLTADFADLTLQSFDLVGGVSRLDLTLSAPVGDTPIRLVGGAKEVRIRRPRGSAVRLRIAGGSGKIEFDGQRIGAAGGETILESAGAEASAERYSVDLTGGMAKVTVGEIGS